MRRRIEVCRLALLRIVCLLLIRGTQRVIWDTASIRIVVIGTILMVDATFIVFRCRKACLFTLRILVGTLRTAAVSRNALSWRTQFVQKAYIDVIASPRGRYQYNYHPPSRGARQCENLICFARTICLRVLFKSLICNKLYLRISQPRLETNSKTLYFHCQLV